jgi:hypothetical protein
VAAIVWIWSAFIKIPEFDNSYVEMVGVKEFLAALRKVSILNAIAARFTMACALLQGLFFYLTSPYFNHPPRH